MTVPNGNLCSGPIISYHYELFFIIMVVKRENTTASAYKDFGDDVYI